MLIASSIVSYADTLQLDPISRGLRSYYIFKLDCHYLLQLDPISRGLRSLYMHTLRMQLLQLDPISRGLRSLIISSNLLVIFNYN